MELRAGYKKTEVGVIPDDWNDVAIDDLNPFVTSGSRGWAKFYSDRGAPFIRITNMSRDSIYLCLVDLKLVDLPERENEGLRTQLQNGDVLVSITADIGIIGYVDQSVPQPAYINQHIALVRFDEGKINSRYISYFLGSENSQKNFRSKTDGGAKAGMSLTGIRRIKFALPSTHTEQTAIANALSDADALIQSLQKLIAKKRQTKQGAMQALLNPFENGVLKAGWMTKKMGDMCDCITTGKLDANAMVENGDYPFFTCAKNHSWIDKHAFDTEALLVSGNGANVGYIHYYNGKFNAYQRTYILSGFTNDIHFLKLYMERNLQDRIRIEVNAGNTPYIVMGTLTEMDVIFPADKAEQSRIATILSDIDADIAALETKLVKYQDIKQGMMQNLLTGRIRLV